MQFRPPNNRCPGFPADETVRRAARLLTLLVLGAVALAGCAHSPFPYMRLSHGSAIRFIPCRPALRPYRSTPCVVTPYAYGYQRAQWHTWTDVWGDESEVLSALPPEAEPTSPLEPPKPEGSEADAQAPTEADAQAPTEPVPEQPAERPAEKRLKQAPDESAPTSNPSSRRIGTRNFDQPS